MDVSEPFAMSISKDAGIIETLLGAPLSGAAAALGAPAGSRAAAGALGAILGAGVAAMAEKETRQRQAQGEQVSPVDMAPLVKAVLTGIAMGGGVRGLREYQGKGEVSTGTAILAGAPTGALLYPGHPVFGSIVGGLAAPIMASLVKKPQDRELADNPVVRAYAAHMAAQARLKVARMLLMQRFSFLRRALVESARSGPSTQPT